MTHTDRFHYLVADYFGTGEGRTVSLMITMLHPKGSEYSRKPHSYQDELGQWHFDPGELGVSIDQVLRRQFSEVFSQWDANGMAVVSREKFMESYGLYVPKMAEEMSRDAVEDVPANFFWHSQLHFNFS